MLYLVNSDVTISYYMGKDNIINITHIVEANSEKEANTKLNEYYHNKDEPYDVSHTVNINYCNPSIS